MSEEWAELNKRKENKKTSTGRSRQPAAIDAYSFTQANMLVKNKA